MGGENFSEVDVLVFCKSESKQQRLEAAQLGAQVRKARRLTNGAFSGRKREVLSATGMPLAAAGLAARRRSVAGGCEQGVDGRAALRHAGREAEGSWLRGVSCIRVRYGGNTQAGSLVAISVWPVF